jgi:hypothetical protein
MTVIYLLLAVAFLTIIGAGFNFWIRFRTSAERRWRDRVLALTESARQCEALARRGINDEAVRRQQAETRLGQQAFAAYLQSIPIEEMAECAGIGPATVAKLRAGGFAHLAALHGGKIALNGLGPKRTADIEAALRDLTAMAHQTFVGGACKEAQEFQLRRQQLLEQSRRRVRTDQARAACVRALLDQLDGVEKAARRVTFWTYWSVETRELVPADMLARALPDLEASLRAAEMASHTPAPHPVAHPAAAGVQPPRGRPPADARSKAESKPPPLVNSSPALMAASAAGPHAQPLHDPALPQMDVVMRFAFCVARADGRIARKELEVIEDHVRRAYGANVNLFNRARAFCAQYQDCAIEVDDCLERAAVSLTTADLVSLLDLGRQIARASGGVNARESALLERAAKRWGCALASPPLEDLPAQDSHDQQTPARARSHPIPPTDFPKEGMPPSPMDECAVLQIDAGVALSAELVRRQFHYLTERYARAEADAPDPESVLFNKAKRESVRRAADSLMSRLGQPLEPPAVLPPTELRANPDLDAVFGA